MISECIITGPSTQKHGDLQVFTHYQHPTRHVLQLITTRQGQYYDDTLVILLNKQQGFFSLLDEYFMTRPHLLGGGGGNNQNRNEPSPLQSLQSLNRFLSPTQPSPTSPTGPKTEEELAREAKDKAAEAKRIEMVSKLASKGVKHGTAGARASLGLINKNSTAMGVMDKYGVGNVVRSADSLMGKKPAQQQGQATNGASSPPPSTGNGASGLVSSKVSLEM
jgi:hypothetical protein